MPGVTTYRPGGTRLVAYGVVRHHCRVVAIGIAMPENIVFTPEDVTLWLIIVVVVALLHGIARSYVRASTTARDLNGYRRHLDPVVEIRGFSMRPGAPWPTLVTATTSG